MKHITKAKLYPCGCAERGTCHCSHFGSRYTLGYCCKSKPLARARFLPPSCMHSLSPYLLACFFACVVVRSSSGSSRQYSSSGQQASKQANKHKQAGTGANKLASKHFTSIQNDRVCDPHGPHSSEFEDADDAALQLLLPLLLQLLLLLSALSSGQRTAASIRSHFALRKA